MFGGFGNLQCAQPKWFLYCYSHNPAHFETVIQTADRCCWQEHLVSLPALKLIGADREKSSAACSQPKAMQGIGIVELKKGGYIILLHLKEKVKAKARRY